MENEKKRGFWSKLWEALGDIFGEIFGELIVLIVSFGIGAGILWLFGRVDLVKDMGPEIVALLGMVAAGVVTVIVLVIAARIKKRRNKSENSAERL